MVVKSADLEIPERDMTQQIETREQEHESHGGGGFRRKKERLEEARRLRPRGEVACTDCWLRGRDAAIGHLQDAATHAGLTARAEEARGLMPQRSDLHRLETWRQGRDAALDHIERGGQ